MGEKVQGFRIIIQNRQGDIKNRIGNREAKELTCTTHGHELRGGSLEGKGEPGRGEERGKNWDNCNSIINKVYFKNGTNKDVTIIDLMTDNVLKLKKKKTNLPIRTMKIREYNNFMLQVFCLYSCFSWVLINLLLDSKTLAILYQ